MTENLSTNDATLFNYDIKMYDYHKEGFNLIFPYYEPMNESRLEEIRLCLNKNIENELIKTIFLFICETDLENLTIPVHDKIIKVILKTERVHFSHVFKFSQLISNGNILKMVLINSDIFLDETLALVDLSGKNLYCLTRHEYINASRIETPH